jgi:hypothetical protein
MDPQGRQPARQRDAREFQAEGPRGRAPHRQVFCARADRAVRAIVLPVQRWQSKASPVTRWRSESLEDCGAASLSWCPATARSATACRSVRCPMCRRPPIPIVNPPTRRAARPLPDFAAEAGDRCPASPPMPQPGRASFTARRQQQTWSSRNMGELGGAVRTALSVEPRDGGCACSCRRWSGRGLSRPGRRRRGAAKKLGLPSISRATRRRTTRA